ncbi:PopZ family protein [Methylocella silvestris]|uniref:DUF2497 domain-containing protein n=1 Tax=Methylocella silvestris TaxID=199596 RepID=A0A2J7TIH4_METSI|nr:DUF2497 domain-containing protein [Methylocella silvestris]PNG26565.1 hypothetical protein CR492_07720 [Methylocella silvestris]
MSAAYSVEASGELSDQRPREPSMEDILASIRRIIAEDQALFAADDSSRARSEEASAADARDASFGDPTQAASPEQRRAAVSEEFGAQPIASGDTSETVAGAFNTLVASRFAQNSDAILALAREALRPMLAAWLDAHLPALVERLVKAEIERMTRGA